MTTVHLWLTIAVLVALNVADLRVWRKPMRHWSELIDEMGKLRERVAHLEHDLRAVSRKLERNR